MNADWMPPNLKLEGVTLELIVDRDHYQRIVKEVLPTARHSIWLATATLKDMRLERGFLEYQSFLNVLDQQARHGCDVRLIHGSDPSAPFQKTFDRLNPRVRLRQCARVHCKILLIDLFRAYLGSANLTGAGMGAKQESRHNFELGIYTEDLRLSRQINAYFERLWNGAECWKCRLAAVCATWKASSRNQTIGLKSGSTG